MNHMRSSAHLLRRSWARIMLAMVLLAAPALWAALALERLTFANSAAQPLLNGHLMLGMSQPLAPALASYGFLSGVGGVAFGGTAVPGTRQQILGLEYRANEPDGRRLSVMLDTGGNSTTRVAAPIHDWLLVPIARFAETDYAACFTLFGKLVDENEQRERLAKGQRILNYHPAFADTLLGLRLFHADNLILDPYFCDLPKESGSYLLGEGEPVPDPDANRRRLVSLRETLNTLKTPHFTSYVICDHGQQVTFDVESGQLALTGFPVWYCWRRASDNAQHLREIQDNANRTANEQVRALFNSTPGMSQAEATAAFHRIFDQEVSASLVRTLPDWTATASEAIRRLDGINPPVYAALTTTMRFAAFFRYVKLNRPTEWRAFLESLATVSPRPTVQTPTVMIPPDRYER